MKTALRRWSLAASAASVTTLVKLSSASAQFAGPDPQISGTPGASNTDPESFRQIVFDVISAILNFLALIAVVVVIIAGIRLIVSQGDDDAKEKAKKTIFYALAGLAIVLFARVIVGLITSYLQGQVCQGAGCS
jgi:hypothetical protein